MVRPVDPGEDPACAAVRETFEESGLEVVDPLLLRVWTYPTPEGWDTVHATYVGRSDAGDPVISHEHTGFKWTTPADYVREWCSEEIEAAFPTHERWIREVRANCRNVAGLIEELDS